MIKLTRLNKEEYRLNALLIKQIETVPDTLLILTNGERHYVRETSEEVSNRITEFYSKISMFAEVIKPPSEEE